MFRSPTALIVWAVWLLFAVANWIDLAVQGHDHASVVAAAVLLLMTGVLYVTAQRPRVIADDAGLTIRNPLRDHRVGWAGVAKVDLADLLRVHCDGAAGPRVISAWAVHHSRRRQLALEARSRRRSRGLIPGLPSVGALPYGTAAPPPKTSAETEALTVVGLFTDRAEAARAVSAVPQTGPLTSTWSARGIAALVIPALILLIVFLL